jgi:hypothetical protein
MHMRTPLPSRYAISASLRSARWLLPPPPGRSNPQSFPGLAHQIRLGRCSLALMR